MKNQVEPIHFELRLASTLRSSAGPHWNQLAAIKSSIGLNNGCWLRWNQSQRHLFCILYVVDDDRWYYKWSDGLGLSLVISRFYCCAVATPPTFLSFRLCPFEPEAFGLATKLNLNTFKIQLSRLQKIYRPLWVKWSCASTPLAALEVRARRSRSKLRSDFYLTPNWGSGGEAASVFNTAGVGLLKLSRCTQKPRDWRSRPLLPIWPSGQNFTRFRGPRQSINKLRSCIQVHNPASNYQIVESVEASLMARKVSWTRPSAQSLWMVLSEPPVLVDPSETYWLALYGTCLHSGPCSRSGGCTSSSSPDWGVGRFSHQTREAAGAVAGMGDGAAAVAVGAVTGMADGPAEAAAAGTVVGAVGGSDGGGKGGMNSSLTMVRSRLSKFASIASFSSSFCSCSVFAPTNMSTPWRKRPRAPQRTTTKDKATNANHGTPSSLSQRAAADPVGQLSLACWSAGDSCNLVECNNIAPLRLVFGLSFLCYFVGKNKRK